MVSNRLFVIKRGDRLEDGQGFVCDGDSAKVFKDDHDAFDVRAKKVRAWLFRICDELEREEHGCTEGVEGAPMEVPWDGQGAVGEEVGAGLGDELGETICSIDGGLERLLPAGVTDEAAGRGLPGTSVGTVKGEANVVEKDTKTKALGAGASDREDRRRKSASETIVVEIKFRRNGLKPAFEDLILGHNPVVGDRTHRHGVVHDIAHGLGEAEEMYMWEMKATCGVVGRVKARGELGVEMVVADCEGTTEHECLPPEGNSSS